jgi:hypothetical protein
MSLAGRGCGGANARAVEQSHARSSGVIRRLGLIVLLLFVSDVSVVSAASNVLLLDVTSR